MTIIYLGKVLLPPQICHGKRHRGSQVCALCTANETDIIT